MGRLFGTDGVRGIANGDLDARLAYAIGRAAAWCMTRDGHAPRFLLGRDTRASGGLLEGAVVAGICSAGADVEVAGVLTTPGIAFAVRQGGFDGGIAITASHNPPEYNGIKLFSSDGRKLPDELEDRIEETAFRLVERDDLPRPTGAAVGRLHGNGTARRRYAVHLRRTAGGDLAGARVVLDCANGSTAVVAPGVFRRLGADVTVLNERPDGSNINMGCGSTSPEAMCGEVVRLGADAGFAFDGDGDRVVGCDEKGRLVDGDRILVACSLHLLRRGLLSSRCVVATTMSNAGLEIALEREGIRVYRSDVGDRNVLEEMLRRDAPLGGERSGHVIFRRHGTSGDGIVTALQVLRAMKDEDAPLSKLRDQMEELPQSMVNVRVLRKEGLEASGAVKREAARIERALGARGRVLLRASGTEPVVRVMVEGENEDAVERAARSLADVVRSELGSPGGGGR